MPCEDFTEKIGDYKNLRKQKKLFGTFGFRGIVNEGMDANKVKQVGAALAVYLGEGKTVAIGKDPRISSDMLEEALVAGITDHGCNALTLGIITPNTLSLEAGRQADAGVMITASHNPPEYNGIKCLGKSGRGFSPEEDLALERIYFGDLNKITKKGERLRDNGASDRYRAHIVRYVTGLFPTTPMRLVVDGGGGSASSVTPETLERLGHRVIRFNCEYDGMFRERNPEPTDANLEKLKKLVIREGADFGVAHDGDGDRTAFVDEKGRFVQGDISAAIIADHVLRQSKDKEKKIAVTIAFSNLIEHVAKTLGAEVIYTPVGEPYLAQAKLLCGAQIGLEEHGSVLLEWSREGPMLAGLMAGILSKEEKSLSELVASYPGYHQIKDAKILPEGMDTQAVLDGLKQEIPGDYESATDMDGIRVDYTDGWFLVRASGTEPKVRVFAEGRTEDIARRLNRTAMEGLERAVGAFHRI
ncbi:phosphomannomutase [Candidatus Methanoperedens nitroreducens]|uniref:Phosphomannomutase n=1 Tax=Candidatus Methanoperedens nitratireducens TaxID=1392998 RepID=A0A062UXP4_9EURY|nr:phosphoglucosamine mutase [Candidatus Methanoperedens nitroreducens]KCZ71751.1 phosphomannomutase [Candidatus Methanoperedens nitroreducens]MDJ1422276.1 phosphoglucosamine mutase [Candidatus Methanoperedens sp.]